MTQSPGTPRIAFVFASLNSGGAERAALNMAAAVKHAHCSVVVERRGGDLTDDPLARNVVFASDSMTRAPRLVRVANLARALRQVEADVAVSMLSPVVTASAARLAGAQVIHWLQAPWSRTTGVAASTVRGGIQRRALRIACGGSAVVAAATPGLCDECVNLGIPLERIALLPNGLDVPSIDPPRDSEAGMPMIVTVGRLEAPKRHDLTIRAVAEINGDMPVRLVVVGSGQDEAGFRQLAAELGVGSQVEFTGFVEAPQEYMRKADVFVLATEYEGFGNVIVEALACGLPVVVSDVPYGPRFILDDGAYGRLVEPGSVSALAAAIRHALDEAPLSISSATELRERAARFRTVHVAERFEALVDIIRRERAPLPNWCREWV
jgi:glycosyltransferase involved in cell wall biosynthesis